jgi:hypothetical protein
MFLLAPGQRHKPSVKRFKDQDEAVPHCWSPLGFYVYDPSEVEHWRAIWYVAPELELKCHFLNFPDNLFKAVQSYSLSKLIGIAREPDRHCQGTVRRAS